MPSPVRTVIAADFDNDQELEIFFNNIAYRGSSANRLFRYSMRAGGAWHQWEGFLGLGRESVASRKRSLVKKQNKGGTGIKQEAAEMVRESPGQGTIPPL
jgi:hypothetical protein